MAGSPAGSWLTRTWSWSSGRCARSPASWPRSGVRRARAAASRPSSRSRRPEEPDSDIACNVPLAVSPHANAHGSVRMRREFGRRWRRPPIKTGAALRPASHVGRCSDSSDARWDVGLAARPGLPHRWRNSGLDQCPHSSSIPGVWRATWETLATRRGCRVSRGGVRGV